MPRYVPIRYTQPPPSYASLAVADALHAHLADSSPVAGGDTSVSADWTARSTAAGVFYANAFEFANTSALQASNYDTNSSYDNARQTLVADSSVYGGACKIDVLAADDEGTSSYRHSWDGVGAHTKSTRKTKFYYQFHAYIDSYLLDTRWKTVANQADVGLKLAIFQEPDQSFANGEVVPTMDSFRGFVTAYRKRASNSSADGFEVSLAVVPGDTEGEPEYRVQNWMNSGPKSSGGDTDATKIALAKQRFGPLHYSDTGTVTYGGGTLTAQGNPDPDAAIGGVTWVKDAWNVVEVFIDQSTDTVQIWHAVRGNAPRLVHSWVGNADIGTGANNYKGVQLLPRLEQRDVDGTQTIDTYVKYAELIASDDWIDFPVLPRNAVTAPSWVASATQLRWYKIGGTSNSLSLPDTNTFTSIDPGRGGSWGGWDYTMTAWNGGIMNPWLGAKGSLCVYGGGHADSHYPDMVRFDIDSRTWSIHNTEVVIGTYSAPASGWFANDFPAPAHNYGQQAYDPSTNTAYSLCVQTSDAPTKVASGGQYDFATGRWRRNAINSQSHIGSGGWAVWDTYRRVVWACGAATGASEFTKFNPYVVNSDGTFGSWTNYGNTQWNAIGQTYWCAGYVPPESATSPDKIIVVTPFGNGVWQIDPASPGTVGTELTVSGTAPSSFEAGNLVYSPRRDSLLYYTSLQSNKAELWELKKRSGSWSWTMITDAGNTVTPAALSGSSGCFGRFNLISYSDYDLVIIIDDPATNVCMMMVA